MAAEFRVYVANLGKYNEGELVGAWFEPPIDWDKMAEAIGLNNQYEEYAIHDYEAPFAISEYETISHINEMGEALAKLNSSDLADDVEELLERYFNDVTDLAEHVDDFIHWQVDSMLDLAQQLVQDGDYCGELPVSILNYIDYQKLADDLEADGTYFETANGVYEFVA